MSDEEVDVAPYLTQTATTLSWQTTLGNIVTLTGSGFTYAGGVPTGGSVDSIGIETNGSPGDDVEIDFGASRAIVLDLIASAEQFWAAALSEPDDFALFPGSSTINPCWYC